MSDSAQTAQTQTNNNNKSGDPASRFLVGILGTLFALLAICTIVLLKPRFLRAIGRLETARQQRVAVDHTIEKRRRARKPKLRDCWIDSERRGGNRSHGDYGTRWADLQVRLHATSIRNILFVDVEYVENTASGGRTRICSSSGICKCCCCTGRSSPRCYITGSPAQDRAHQILLQTTTTAPTPTASETAADANPRWPRATDAICCNAYTLASTLPITFASIPLPPSIYFDIPIPIAHKP